MHRSLQIHPEETYIYIPPKPRTMKQLRQFTTQIEQELEIESIESTESEPTKIKHKKQQQKTNIFDLPNDCLGEILKYMFHDPKDILNFMRSNLYIRHLCLQLIVQDKTGFYTAPHTPLDIIYEETLPLIANFKIHNSILDANSNIICKNIICPPRSKTCIALERRSKIKNLKKKYLESLFLLPDEISLSRCRNLSHSAYLFKEIILNRKIYHIFNLYKQSETYTSKELFDYITQIERINTRYYKCSRSCCCQNLIYTIRITSYFTVITIFIAVLLFLSIYLAMPH